MPVVDDDLIVYGVRLLIPKSLRRETLECLHDGHQGIDRTKRRVRQTVYWPKIDRDIENMVSSCIKCRPPLQNQRNEPLWQEDIPSSVFESVSTDYFHVIGRTYLVYIDRLSGWPCVSSCQGIASAANLIRSLRAIFSDTGVPALLKTDGGPQFASSALRRFFLSRWGVEHRITSPYHPKANGHAEASVKIIKKLIMTTAKNGNLDTDEFARGMLELRNTPRADGRSPAQVLFGYPLRSCFPTHRRSFAKDWQKKAEECVVKAEYLRSQAKQRYNSTRRPLSHLKMIKPQDFGTAQVLLSALSPGEIIS
ncbi:uncharacterized protein K02A2.6-like [Macrobrachium nipponense]|uniref:uncharacterized protein K02A2.6-like n=1 Tax=Macrobrachium nipponense TaxID=159736 RepID=UPI0030C8C57F